MDQYFNPGLRCKCNQSTAETFVELTSQREARLRSISITALVPSAPENGAFYLVVPVSIEIEGPSPSKCG